MGCQKREQRPPRPGSSGRVNNTKKRYANLQKARAARIDGIDVNLDLTFWRATRHDAKRSQPEFISLGLLKDQLRWHRQNNTTEPAKNFTKINLDRPKDELLAAVVGAEAWHTIHPRCLSATSSSDDGSSSDLENEAIDDDADDFFDEDGLMRS
jgi:hypothetical protein